MSKKFQVIVADCPWSFKDTLKMSDVKRGADANYHVMANSDIQQLPVKKLISPTGSILALWVPSSLLQEGLDTMKAWGFAHKQTYVWVKTKKTPLSDFIHIVSRDKPTDQNFKSYFKQLLHMMSAIKMSSILAFGMGRLFRQTHEICLIGTSNGKIYQKLKNKSRRSVSFAPNLKHSSKPEDLQDSLDIMFPRGNRLELFARRHRTGWLCLGDEVCNGEDIRDSLAKL